MKKIAYKEMYENEMSHAWYIATRKLMIKFILKHLGKDSKILDAGCGTGGTIEYFKKSGFTNVYGVDVNRDAINYCQKREIENISFGNVNKLTFKTNSFDAVICLDVLYHKDIDKNMALKQFGKVLKKGGILYIQEPAFNWLISKHDAVIETESRLTAGEIKELIKKSDFKIIKLSYFNFFLAPLIIFKRMSEKVFVKNRETSDVNRLNKYMNLVMLKILFIETIIIEKFSIPFGISIICISRK